MRLLSVILAFLAAGALAVYVLTCSVNNTPPAPVHPIVGKWRMEMFCGQPTAKSGEVLLCQFKADGSYEADTFIAGENIERVVGRYEIGQDVASMTLTTNSLQTVAPRSKIGRLEFIESNSKFVIKSDNISQTETWVRIKN